MKKTLIFITALALTVLTLVTSCQKDLFHFVKGTPVKFGITSSGSSLTRAAYSEIIGNSVQRIDWKKDDRIRIYCKASSDVEEERYADYKVTEDGEDDGDRISSATVVSYDGKELCWGTSTDPHTFYAVYPSPGFPSSESPGITVSIEDNVVTGNLPSTDQGKMGDVKKSDGNYVVTPDLKWMMMTAKAGPFVDGMPDDEVLLEFQPLTTAIEFTIYNGDKNAPLPVNKVKLISESTQISGKFTVDISTLDDSYYPTCTGTMEYSKEVCIDMSALDISLDKAKGDKTADCKSLTFTFFLAPITDVSDLTFQIYTGDKTWKKTRLKYTDGSGVEFPCHKKTLVKGLLVPEGAQWTVKYDPAVDPWTSGGGPIKPSPEMQMGETTLVTSWDTGVEEDLNFSGESDPIEWIDLGLPSGTLWASKNIGSMKDTDPGYYFSWGNTSGYKRNASNTGWISASDNTPFENGFTNDNYSTTSGALRTSDFMANATYDAATAEYGTDYATADQTAYNELLAACYWVKCDGETVKYKNSKVNGYIVYKRKSDDESTTYDQATAGVQYTEDDTHIFIPIGGYGNGDGIDEGGINGFLWTSTFVDSNIAQNIKLHDDENDNPDYVSIIANHRYYGFNIRAVQPMCFSVSNKSEAPYDDVRKVLFAPGNLYWSGSAFKFEANQYDYRGYNGCVGDNAVINGKSGTTPSGTCGLFYWFNYKTLGNSYAVSYTPDAEASANDIFFTNNLVNERIAHSNVTVNGEKGKWRTLTANEWNYLLKVRKVNGKTGYGNTCAWATVNSVKGIIIFHDKYSGSTENLTSIPEGCAFLPAAGFRGVNIGGANVGYYCSSTAYGAGKYYYTQFTDGSASAQTSDRSLGRSVRLVRDL